ncbi:MAG: hypothetical protein JWO36_4194 [Myxococcales bacterium]|nr:hypothetical protein [Myxococcales bacterium]
MLMALVLSATRRGAHAFETIEQDQLLRVFLEVGTTRVEEMRLPRELRESLVDELKELTDDKILDFGAGRRYTLQIQLGPSPRIFRVELEPA